VLVRTCARVLRTAHFPGQLG